MPPSALPIGCRSSAAPVLSAAVLSFILLSAGAFAQKNGGSFDEARVAILWNGSAAGRGANDQASFAAAFRSVNIQVDTLSAEDPGDWDQYNLLVLPASGASVFRDLERLHRFVKEGGSLILDGRSRVAQAFGIAYRDSIAAVNRMLDRYYPEDTLRLPAADTLERFAAGEGDELFCREAATGEPVVIGRTVLDGRILYFGMLFDPLSTGGYTRFPFLLNEVRDFFHLRPVLRRDYLEMYFDPGYRHNDDIDSLASRWYGSGVRVIHAAGWHQHPTWSYNYAGLIEACHRRGMKVYAWLEPPHVSERFWRQHPEWQEVNYRGEPIPPQWRYLEALTDSACLEKVKAEYVRFLDAYDWDGVNLAELYFESENGPRAPGLYTPMHPSARREFGTKQGFDPALLFDSSSTFYWKKNHRALLRFERYRTETVLRLHEALLGAIEEVRPGNRQFEVIVTAFDDMGNPELHSDFGVSVSRLLKLQKKRRFTLQIEDPQVRWSGSPDRYERIGRRYKELAGPRRRVMIDINILRFREAGKRNTFPTLIQTGTECYEMVRSAASPADGLTIYSESTVRENDLPWLAYAAAAPATVRRVANGWRVVAPFPVVLELPERYAALFMPNGERLASANGRFELPEGEYTLLKSP